MSKIMKSGIVILLLIPAVVLAHGPSRRKVDTQIEINAPADKVWSIISDFCSIKKWDPAVTDCTDDKGTEVDSVRILTLENGEQMHEKLLKYDPDNMKYQYMLLKANVKAMPINTHGSTLQVRAGDDGKTIVEWKGAFYRSFPGPNPPPELSDEAGIKILTDFYNRGLQKIKELAE